MSRTSPDPDQVRRDEAEEVALAEALGDDAAVVDRTEDHLRRERGSGSAGGAGTGDAGFAARRSRSLLRASSAPAIGTALSRVTGLVRIAALTAALGLTEIADVYNLANTTPNILFELVLGGVLSSTLVPLSDHGIDHRIQTQAEGDWTFTGGFQAMQSILRNAKPIPSAIFAQNDMMAFGAMEAIKEHGLSVPGDISVIGFDNLEQCEYSHPKLSTISVDIEGLAAIACRQLENFIDTGIRYRFKAVIPTRLVQRRSVGKPRSIASE